MSDIQAEQPDWLIGVNREGGSMDLATVVPLDADELIATAARAEGLTDFGDDFWREPYSVLLRSLNEQAELTLFGRVTTRDMLLNSLRNRLRVEETYARHPQIDDEVIREPVIVVGLPRSGTSILFETLMRDAQFKSLLAWEVECPCPPPEAATYDNDSRIPLAHERITRRARMSRRMQSMHELGAQIPAECGTAHLYFSFLSESLQARYNVPDYAAYLSSKGDLKAAYTYHKRLLKLLQWKNPRRHWLLKSPPYLWHLDLLFETFPDAKVLFSHRDPLRAMSSGVSLIATLRGMWSDKTVNPASFAQVLQPEVSANGLNRIIDQIEAGSIPRDQLFDSHYENFMSDPISAVRTLYEDTGLTLKSETEVRMTAFLKAKPQGKFGAHNYEVIDDPAARRAFARYQAYFGLETEN